MTEETLQAAIFRNTELKAKEADRVLYCQMREIFLESQNKTVILTMRENFASKKSLEINVSKGYAESILQELIEECDEIIALRKKEILEL